MRSVMTDLIAEERNSARQSRESTISHARRSTAACTQVNCRHRGTLLVPTNAFCHPSLRKSPLYDCGRNKAAPRDENGHIVIDGDPEVVRHLMCFITTLHDDEDAAEPPLIPENLQHEWQDLLSMFKLGSDFFDARVHRRRRGAKDMRAYQRGREEHWDSGSSASYSSSSGSSSARFLPRTEHRRKSHDREKLSGRNDRERHTWGDWVARHSGGGDWGARRSGGDWDHGWEADKDWCGGQEGWVPEQDGDRDWVPGRDADRDWVPGRDADRDWYLTRNADRKRHSWAPEGRASPEATRQRHSAPADGKERKRHSAEGKKNEDVLWRDLERERRARRTSGKHKKSSRQKTITLEDVSRGNKLLSKSRAHHADKVRHLR